MIDLHCHILPGVDDGAQTEQQALEMARMAVRAGVHTVAATPHTNIAGVFENYASDELDARFDAFRALLRRENVPLRLVTGAEIYADGDLVDLLQRGRVPTLGGTRYPLVEFSFHDRPARVLRVLQELLDAGYTPVIAHPERYVFVQRDPRGLVPLFADMGCVLQINKGSPLGRFGDSCLRVSRWMLERGLVHLAASDAHRDHMRTPWLADIRAFLYDVYGDGCPQLLLERNPAHILRDEPVEDAFD
ncbi:MAG TPA: hypothetical protein IAA32_06460 [Candidatus Butyricicoccus stercorigallinarum]|nr:hypothetical protein [Candidatus Butyricicoccus stercorigallinarum]